MKVNILLLILVALIGGTLPSLFEVYVSSRASFNFIGGMFWGGLVSTITWVRLSR